MYMSAVLCEQLIIVYTRVGYLEHLHGTIAAVVAQAGSVLFCTSIGPLITVYCVNS
jgi:hypothetical protein